MLRAIKQYAAEHDIECYISMEERMACGIGALPCLRLPVEGQGCAQQCEQQEDLWFEGPVFLAEEVEI